MAGRLAVARQHFVKKKEKEIVFGGKRGWEDVEADECCFDRSDVSKDLQHQDVVMAIRSCGSNGAAL